MTEHYPCPIQFFDPYINDSPSPSWKKTGIEDLFATSDIVSVHLPVADDTRGMIDKKLLRLMKREAIFVNTARAVVVNRNDLYDSLRNNLVRGAILDVFDAEPPDELDYKIIDLPNVLATPHIAGATFEVEDHHVRILNEVLQEWFVSKRKTGDKLANKEILTVYTR